MFLELMMDLMASHFMQWNYSNSHEQKGQQSAVPSGDSSLTLTGDSVWR